ncbi:DUF5696 domain-containing protein [Paenibacillus lemnae]|uniref:Uncharacterized protein n=1 Tax=Paenibacillus lemnae TaxID=1330551 RepID=A0A848M2X4_PAELE|nr:DUF5696 domain-containing protein [Paenibacillus lemnae]NMO94619.1 hypothetical protein [Paenibacillus lemnae]
MRWIWRYKKWLGYTAAILLVIVFISQAKITFRDSEGGAEAAGAASAQPSGEGGAVLPDAGGFQLAAETETLRLKFHEATGHFMVEDKRNGHIFRSYPDPEEWEQAGVGGAWASHLVSPLMYQHIDMSNPNANPKESSFTRDEGKVENVQLIDGGVEFVFDVPSAGFKIPVSIRVEDDYVETSVQDEELVETGKDQLLWLRAYPFFSAVQAREEDGYLFIPDGSGALVSFQDKRSTIKQMYQERVYGADGSFISSPSSRNNVVMPVYGMKAGDQAFIAVIHEGAPYSDIIASPAGVLSNYHWIGTQQNYRMRYTQVTNESANRSFETYTKGERFRDDRVTRYYLLDEKQADYAGMASKYREYLVKEQELKRLTPDHQDAPFFLTMLGADREKGVFTDRYIQATTASGAMQIVQELYGLGVQNIKVTYLGWQKGGYSALGGYLPVDERIGGAKGLKHFVDYAHSLDIPVYLEVNYGMNNTKVNGFRPRHHGVRDLSGTLMRFSHQSGDDITMVSRTFMVDSIQDDMADFAKLGIDGLLMEGIGRFISTDYNSRYGGTRSEAAHVDQQALQTVRDQIGGVQLRNPGFYALSSVQHIYDLVDDYSYDLFSSRAVPFAQIALHGLVTYTSTPENGRSQYRMDFLKDIEHGAYPSFDFTMTETSNLGGVYWYAPVSSHFQDWKVEAVEQYQRYNEVFADIQDRFIIGHRQIKSGVMETEYEGGTRVIVNYNDEAYESGNIQVPAMDYAVIKGGKVNAQK